MHDNFVVTIFTQNKLFFFLLAGIVNIISALELDAATITKFPESDFGFTAHTTKHYTLIYNQTNAVGYKYKPQNIGNAYQLTDTIPMMTVAIGNKNRIDLNQDGQLDLKLFFGTGNIRYARNENNPIGHREISDGICFVLLNKDTIQNLIGGEMAAIGYGGLPSSFAIEFDTEYNEFGEGGDTNKSNHHIAYIKDGNMTALPGTYQPMQNNGANVGIAQGLDVKIVWRKGYYSDNTPYHDLLTYIEEKDSLDSQGGKLILRDSMRFNSLNEVIAGLKVDKKCQALVTGGVTSATCLNATRHMVQFMKLETMQAPLPPHSPLTAVITGSCNKIYDGPAGIIVVQVK